MRHLNDKQLLGLNIYEILLKEDFLGDLDYLKNFLLDCQCIIFLVDITNNESYLIQKKMINILTNLNSNIFDICSLLFVFNKIDLENEKKIDENEVNLLINDINGVNDKNIEKEDLKEIIEKIDISVTTKKNLNILWEKVYQCVNKIENKRIPINAIKERLEPINTKKNVNDLVKSDGMINIVLMGDSGVGKSNFLNMYFNNIFVETFISTIGIDRKTKIIKYKNLIYNVNISDTAGQERFRSLPLRYFKNAEGILLLYDVSSVESFKNIERWVDDMKSNEKYFSQVIYVIGNKIDIKEREVSYEEGEDLAKQLGFKYYEMSCKINMNIFEIFSRLIKDCIKKINPNNITMDNSMILTQNVVGYKKKTCC